MAAKKPVAPKGAKDGRKAAALKTPIVRKPDGYISEKGDSDRSSRLSSAPSKPTAPTKRAAAAEDAEPRAKAEKKPATNKVFPVGSMPPVNLGGPTKTDKDKIQARADAKENRARRKKEDEIQEKVEKATFRTHLDPETSSPKDVMRGVGSVKKYSGAPVDATNSPKNLAKAAKNLRRKGVNPNEVISMTTDPETGFTNVRTRLDAHQEEKVANAPAVAAVERETDRYALDGGRTNRIFTGKDATNPESRVSLGLEQLAQPTYHQEVLGRHVRNFISLSAKPNKTRQDHQAMEAARQGFHGLLASGVKAPQGMESICSTPGCSRTVEYGDKDGVPAAKQQRTPQFGDQCPGGTCNVKPSISPDSFNRPRG